MNDKLPSWEQALNLLIENGCSNDVIIHCKKVAELAAETAETVKNAGLKVDILATEQTISGLVNAIEDYLARRK